MGTTKRFEADGHPRLVYDDLGERSAPPVVLLHGGGAGNRNAWHDIPRRLAGTYRVLAPDLRGHGDSDRANGDYRIDHYASDIERFIEQVAGGPAALVGHSLGGLVAAQVAGTRPDLVTKAFFEDPPLHWDGRQPRSTGRRAFRPDEFRAKVRDLLDGGATAADVSAVAWQEWAETGDFFRPRQDVLRALRDRGVAIEEMVTAIRDAPSPLGGKIGDLIDEAMMRRIVTGLLACDPEVFTPGKDFLAAYDPNRPMTCPVHLLRADPAVGLPIDGGAFPPEQEGSFLATHPHATVEFVPGVGHAIHEQKPDFFTERLEAFLAAESPEHAVPQTR